MESDKSNSYKKMSILKSKNNTSPIKFIHASDIHLGAHQFQNDIRANDFIFAFKKILALAKYHFVNFIILGGDVFTSLELLPEKLSKIVNLLKKFINLTNGEIPIVVIEGNHDIRKFSKGSRVNHGQSWLKFLHELGLIILLDADFKSNSRIMYPLYNFDTKKGGKIIIDNVTIYGNHYIGQTPEKYINKIYESIDECDENFKILIQHFGIEGQMENVPGLKYKSVLPLKEKINYLALGHFHKQFVIDNWIFNPGSSEAACSIDYSYRRGVFLVRIDKEKKYKPKVISINLKNREIVWKTLSLKFYFTKTKSLTDFILNTLKREIRDSDLENRKDYHRSPILYLKLLGIKPQTFSAKDKKIICSKMIEEFNFADVKIHQKFGESFTKLDTFIHTKNKA